MRMIIKAVYGIYLLLMSARDIKCRELPIVMLGAGLVFVPPFILTDNSGGVLSYIYGAIPGIIFLIVSYLSRGQIGAADACVLICMGLCIGIEPVIGVISISLLAIALVSMIMLVMGKLNRKSTLPYIPFALLGYLLYIFII